MTNIIQDGTFLLPIEVGEENIYEWTDWTGAGITTQNPAPSGIPGDYASLPVGADLFEDFSPLAPGNYTLTFYVENQSPNEAKLVLAISQFLGIPIAQAFADGTAEELTLPASMTGFVKETFNFTITSNENFVPEELYFSNSYDNPIPPITDSINPPGTIINIADVTLTLSPVPTVAPDTAHVSVGGTVTANAAHGVLAIDVDPVPNDTLTVSAVDGLASDVGQPVAGRYGTLTLNADGSYSYVADSSVPSNVIAQDIFTYTATDGDGGSATTSLTITVTQAGQTYIAGTPGEALTSGNGSVFLDGSLLQNETITAGTGNDAVLAGSNDSISLGNGTDVVNAENSDTFTLGNGAGDTVVA